MLPKTFKKISLYLHTELEKPIKNIYIPSYESLVLIFLLFISIPYYDIFQTIYFRSTDYLHNWPFISSMEFIGWAGTFVISLAIFIAEQFRENTIRGKAFLRATLLWPILVYSILGAAWAYFFPTHFFTTILAVLLACLIGKGFYNLLRLLLSNQRMIKAEKQLLSGSFKNVIDETLKTQESNVLLLKQFSYSPFSNKGKTSSWPIESLMPGVIKAIDEERLSRLLKQAKDEAITLTNPINTTGDAQQIQAKDKKVSIDSTYPELSLCKLIGSYVSESDNTLAFVETGGIAFSKEFKQELNNRIQQAFTISKGESLSEELRQEISELKDALAAAITAKAPGRVEELLGVYVELAGAFSEEMQSHGIHHNHITADALRHSIGNQLRQLDWLTHDIYELFILSIESQNMRIASRIAHLPFTICSNAIESGDHYVYQEFLRLAESLLEVDSIENDSRDKLIESFLLSLRTSSDYYLAPKLERETSVDSPLLGFAFPQFQALQLLLKFHISQALKGEVDTISESTFSNVLATANKLFSFMPFPQSIGILESLNSWRIEMFLGLGGWTFKHLVASQNPNELRYYWDSIRNLLPDSLVQLSNAYTRLAQNEYKDLWHLTFWDTKPDGEAHSIDTFDWITKVYLVRSLEILSSNTILGESLSLPDKIASHAFKIKSDLLEIKKDISHWQQYSSACTEENISRYDLLLSQIIKQNEFAKTQSIRDGKISTSKINEFATLVTKAFTESAILRNILKYHMQFTDSSQVDKPEINSIGMSVSDSKEPFLPKSDTIFFGWGENYGQGLARGETQNILNNLIKQTTPAKLEDIGTIIKDFRTDNTIIIATGESAILEIYKLPNVTMNHLGPSKSPEIPNPDAYYSNSIPIYCVHSKEKLTNLLILDKAIPTNLVQYSPYPKSIKTGFGTSSIRIDVDAFSDNEPLLTEFLSRKYPWITNQRTPEEQTEYLRAKVLVYVAEKFEFIIPPKFRGRRIPIVKSKLAKH
ncbi:TPA: hypothetical protein HA242_01985 [Candidatus Woesearchaeota archaeon]|nr:hypothetical protein [Candidatus Woesearchaeota archaeon]